MQHSIASSQSTVPYSLVQSPVSGMLEQCRRLDLPWAVLINMRSWMRFRAGFVEVATQWHPSSCIFCGMLARGSGAPRRRQVHVLGKCSHWKVERAVVLHQLGGALGRPDQIALAMLRVKPDEQAFACAVDFCAKIDAAARKLLG